ncbi:MAG TPA: thiazole biosynthesis enzyme, partial [Acidobacteria bacterium]|nr:thiazole biosynthesis enzyme [Acidobacteriota bacterium]
VRQEKVAGIVINWTSVEMAGLHVDPLTVFARFVIDATGHPIEVVKALERKMNVRLFTPSGKAEGEKSMWAELGEAQTLKNTREVYPGLYVTGMSANATFGSYRMGPIFGGMLLSGRKVAELIIEKSQIEKSK